MMPVCVKCQLFYHLKKNEVYVEEGMPQRCGACEETKLDSTGSNDCQTCSGEGETWVPYKLWAADLLECRGCDDQIISGFGQQPVAESFQREVYERWKKAHPPMVFVEDCC